MFVVCSFFFFFFFSSRRRHTRCSRDWSSDVCSSDLRRISSSASAGRRKNNISHSPSRPARALRRRSEERRVGKECRSRGSPYHYKKSGGCTKQWDGPRRGFGGSALGQRAERDK